MAEKNLKQKLQEARMLLKTKQIKKTGQGGMSKNGYFTLGDVEPYITELINNTFINSLYIYRIIYIFCCDNLIVSKIFKKWN